MTVDAAAGRTNRVLQFAPRMSPAEAVMWKISDDPWLRPIAGTLAVVDQPIDADLFRQRMAYAVSVIPRLRERVAPPSAPWAPPHWVPDEDFDLDYHLRHVGMAAGGSIRELQELVSRWYEDPLDPSRPLWQFVVVDGVADGCGALFGKLHHTITDGIGLLRLSELYLDVARDAPPPPPVDLDRVIAEAATEAADRTDDRGDSLFLESVWQLSRQAVRLAAAPVAVAERTAEHAASAMRHPERVLHAAMRLLDTARDAAGQLEVEDAGASALWKARSARRHLEFVRVPLDGVKRVGQKLGGSVNDVFVTGAVDAVVAYHSLHGAPLEALTFTFVVSQRQGSGVGGNFFTPVKVRLPVPVATAKARLAAVRDAMAVRREPLRAGGASLNLVAGLAQFLPASMLGQYARAQVAGVDFATSNLRGAPVPLYIAGARVLHSAPLGPLAGTPFNLTTLSYDGSLDMGLLVDPVAVQDPVGLRNCLEEAYQDLLHAAR
jgi:diacylglycerol O-acyltransferase / wax synthase